MRMQGTRISEMNQDTETMRLRDGRNQSYLRHEDGDVYDMP